MSESDVTSHQAALSITESQISDLQSYLTSIPAQSFASLTGKPTTVAGYGITDALTSVPAQSFASLTGKPTTIAGYGITDAYANSEVDAHLNQSGPTSGYVLSWNGSDYDWVANNGTGNDEESFAIHTADFNATAGSRHAVDTSSNIVTATLPGSPATGDAIFFADAGGNYATNNLTIGRNGNTIMGLAQDMTVSTNNESFGLFYNGTTWRTY